MCLKLFFKKEQLMFLATLFLQEMLINIQTRHIHSSINHREQLFDRALITGYFRPMNIAKFLGTSFFIEQLQRRSLADYFQNRVTPLFLNISQTSQESTCVGVSF